MSSSLPVPFFPTAPEQYTPEYMSEVVRSFSVFLNQYNNSLLDTSDADALAWFMGS